MLLGFLLSDIPAAEVYQLHREPPDWNWQEQGAASDIEIDLVEPASRARAVALVLSLSATIHERRVTSVLGDDVAIWRMSLREPHNDFLRSRRDLERFRRRARRMLDRIKARHPAARVLHVFPAVPVAVAVEFGRIVMPKADLALRIYDEQRTLGGFIHALDIGESPITREEEE